jgi:hypothetical protein
MGESALRGSLTERQLASPALHLRETIKELLEHGLDRDNLRVDLEAL